MDDLRIIVAEQTFEEAGEDVFLLKKLNGRFLLRPANPHFQPDPACLAWHRKRHGFEI